MPGSASSVDRTASARSLGTTTWIGLPAPAAKLLLGVPYYGRGWTGVRNTNNGLFQPGSAAQPAAAHAATA